MDQAKGTPAGEIKTTGNDGKPLAGVGVNPIPAEVPVIKKVEGNEPVKSGQ